LHISQTKLFIGELFCELTIDEVCCCCCLSDDELVVVDADVITEFVTGTKLIHVVEIGSDREVLTSGGLGEFWPLFWGSLLQLPGDAEELCCDCCGLCGSAIPAIPWIFCLCFLRKYLLQNSF